MSTRRLAAIVMVDVVGSSHLISADEPRTLAALEKLQTGVIAPAVRRRGGRVVRTTGDGALLEFASAVAAVECAVEI
jgi:adenylate cyclase